MHEPENSVIDADGADKRRIAQIFSAARRLQNLTWWVKGRKMQVSEKSAFICVISVKMRFLGLSAGIKASAPAAGVTWRK